MKFSLSRRNRIIIIRRERPDDPNDCHLGIWHPRRRPRRLARRVTLGSALRKRLGRLGSGGWHFHLYMSSTMARRRAFQGRTLRYCAARHDELLFFGWCQRQEMAQQSHTFCFTRNHTRLKVTAGREFRLVGSYCSAVRPLLGASGGAGCGSHLWIQLALQVEAVPYRMAKS